MALANFPNTPTLAWSVNKALNFGTRMQRSISGVEIRIQDYIFPLCTFDLTYEVLRDPWDQRAGFGVGPAFYQKPSTPYNELRDIQNFYVRQMGPTTPFLFNDPTDNTTRINPSIAQTFYFATGDGVSQTFQIVSPLYVPVMPVTLNFVDPVAAYVIDYDKGTISFAIPPADAYPIGIDFTYSYIVRFSDDSLAATNFLYQLWNLRKLSLTSVLPP